jgi:hypothetical protein
MRKLLSNPIQESIKVHKKSNQKDEKIMDWQGS